MGMGDDQPGQAPQQGCLRNRQKAHHLRVAHSPGRPDPEPRQRGVFQAKDARLPPDGRCEAHARARTRNARRVRRDPGQADLRRSARSRNEDRGSDVLLRAARARFARRVARARIQTQYWGVAPAPIRGARSPEPQTRGRIRPRYPRLCSTNASEKDFSHFPLDAIHT